MSNPYRLYAMTHSLYSGRARSYLIKAALPFQELSMGHDSYRSEVLPQAGIATIPTVVTPEGGVIRDGPAIVEHLEAERGHPCRPEGSLQQLTSALLDVIGGDGLLRPAMHYRWNFPEENLEFLKLHFLFLQKQEDSAEEKAGRVMDRMRFVAQVFGVNDNSAETIEQLYLDFLTALNTHFEQYPYLLGWKPCVGDFGLLAPLYAHLGRDPYPLRLMQQHAPRVYRWVERMNRLDQDAPEYLQAGEGFLEGDVIPPTLVAVLRVIAEDFMPETKAAAQHINAWLAEHAPESGAPAVGREAQAIGLAEFKLRDQTIQALAQPYRFYRLQCVQDAYDALSDSVRADFDSLLNECGMAGLMDVRLDRRIVRQENLEVWV